MRVARLAVPTLIVAFTLVATPRLWSQSPQQGGGGSILYLLEPAGRLQLGQEMQGALSSSDYVSIRDSYLDAWAFEGQGGTRVTFDLISEEFDGYLYLVGPGFAETVSDDDSGGGCNPRVTVTLLEDGVFRIVASSSGGRNTGIYTIRATEGDGEGTSYPCGGINPELLMGLPTGERSVAFGDTASGRLSSADERMEGRPIQAWALEGVEGQSVTVLLRSNAFDSYLYILGPGLEEPLSDDDGAGDLDSKINLTFPETGTYTLVASSLSRGGTGSFQIIVAESRQVDDIWELETDGRQLTVEETATGFLSATDWTYDGRPVQAWALEGDTGMRVRITLESGDFDSYLYFIGPGMSSPMSDDDSAGDLDSEIETTLREAGTYYVIASGLGGGASGEYRLTVSVREE